ncbi:toxin-coregulated pilus protein TcpH [Aliivibrio fischeri]|uniref:toxin-coregulated pilus protein TcpH n=1 Tax=Aliivibrio fischeri TaxID=668 RepID=UPI001F45870F|nr:toxin-coregulated pilus protein TcpH [Aliivibrio fischeri]MCE7535481.1 toxin-coregulated pilus protein TcpH [Aliivibrio fischeri]MCE7557253.1 toxin-coregulated pilus protein TcpH [Aliivibrio fischeri]
MKSQISKTLIVFSVVNLLIIIIWHKFYRVDLVGTITINEKQVNYVKYEKYLDSVNVVNTKYSDDIAVPATSTATKYFVDYNLSQGKLYAYDGTNYYILNIYSLGDSCFVTLPAGSGSLKKIGFSCKYNN